MSEKQVTVWTWVSRVLQLLGLLAGVLASADKLPAWIQEHAALSVALLAVAVGWVNGMLPAKPSKILPAAALLLLAGLMMLSACQPYAAAWKTLDGIQKAKSLTAQQLAEAARKKHAECKAEHGVKNEAFADCVRQVRKALADWQKIARPAINSAVQITATSLQIAEQVKADKKVDWLKLLKPAACALSRVARAWGHWFADKGAALLGVLTIFEGMTCPQN